MGTHVYRPAYTRGSVPVISTGALSLTRKNISSSHTPPSRSSMILLLSNTYLVLTTWIIGLVLFSIVCALYTTGTYTCTVYPPASAGTHWCGGAAYPRTVRVDCLPTRIYLVYVYKKLGYTFGAFAYAPKLESEAQGRLQQIIIAVFALLEHEMLMREAFVTISRGYSQLSQLDGVHIAIAVVVVVVLDRVVCIFITWP
ncbi:hypothetical protein GGR51DRAFT_357274 [Nemania sp. FL0031]|nr:hypothetical protein GGR51DRAFT_357274 [Nemania sp. FL0031]